MTSLNSKYFHVTISGCKNLTLQILTIRAPSESPNTDGIHIGKSIGVNITGANIQTGDDCVSVGDGSQQINIEKVRCGPGHGISVEYPDEEPVIGIIVKSCSMSNTKNGIRIKTWPASSRGLAADLHFEDFVKKNVCRPIIIDQRYCPYGKCKAKVPSRVKISTVSFKKMRGTSATRVAMKLGCSRRIPCQNVMIRDINLTYTGSGSTSATTLSECANVEVMVSGQVIPPAIFSPYGN
ncbi:hypothetical protein L6164_031544 [Bauhinia variegata]|uniref:Uncharacterized protein n=1 Tax=Bauhinia variegata TaxID=167791 RepID=A0ACB9LG74_BAUVA|nr:hypothetical protein L6164_031544 [Bauhinia variegata]